MPRKTGKEMRSLILAVSISTTLLVLVIIAYFMVSIIVTTNNNIEHNKEKMIEESISSLNDVSKIATMTGVDLDIIDIFNPEIVEGVFAGEMEYLYDTAITISKAFYPVDYVALIRDGEVVAYGSIEGVGVDPEEMSTEPPEGRYATLDSLGDQEGFYVSVFSEVDLGILGIEESFYLNMIIDRTEELAETEEYFQEQRNDLILQLSIAAIIAIILTLLLTTLGLRYFTNKYVARPIEELNRAAEEIADGTFDGELEVDKDSAYAALQGLLRSGQKVLKRMDEEMRE
jgi:HAMP domain-containing protein